MLALAAVVAVCAWGATTAAAAPLDTTGTLGAAPYRLVAPETWNGTLVVLAHGYRDRADHPGEVDDVSPDGGFTALIGALHGERLRRRVDRLLVERLGGEGRRPGPHQPRRASPAAGSAGRSGRCWSGSRSAACRRSTSPRAATASSTATSPRARSRPARHAPWDSAAAGLVAWQTVSGRCRPRGGPSRTATTTSTSRREALPVLGGLLLNPMNLGRFEFMRLVTRVPLSPGYYPGGLATNVFFITEARGELERRAGGPVAQNLTHTYALSAADRAYLGTLGISGAQIDAWLATMNGTRFAAPPGAAELDRALRHASPARSTARC